MMNEKVNVMNERIKEFARQTGLCDRDGDFFGGKISQYEEFAELIVQECVNVLHDNELWNRHISHALKEHFGVER